jgi:hypothetical protein
MRWGFLTASKDELAPSLFLKTSSGQTIPPKFETSHIAWNNKKASYFPFAAHSSLYCGKPVLGLPEPARLTSLPQHSGRAGKLDRSHPPPRA